MTPTTDTMRMTPSPHTETKREMSIQPGEIRQRLEWTREMQQTDETTQ